MTLCITIHKAQGEDRVRVPGKGLTATQHALFFGALRIGSATGHARFFTARRGSAAQVRRHAEEVFGPLTWHGTPDTEGMYGIAEVHL
jgi:hypothetical protein